ncbi:MAG: DsbA family protein, partial [Hyphomicrobiales bacterium]
MLLTAPQTMIARIVAGLACLLLVAGCGRQEDKAFEKDMREYLLAHPEVIQEAAIKLRQKQAAASASVLKNAQARLERDPRDFVANPNGAITVVQF